MMNTYKIFTVGCKVAQAEGHELRGLLEQRGLREAGRAEAPDLCVVNTCAVTATAAAKSRRLIVRLARRFPHGRIALLGCYASSVERAVQDIPQVALIADHHQGIQSALEHFLLQNFAGPFEAPHYSATSQGGTSCNTNTKPHFKPQVKNNFPTSPRQPRHRAFLKIQDGCNAGCTYCIIPQLRPKIHSLDQKDALHHAKALLDAGHREIVLTGIFLGAYGKLTTRKNRHEQSGEPLVDLILELLKLPNLGRLRLSSLEPLDLTPALISALAGSPAVAGHLHLPLQSGSDNILRRMGRQYRSADFLRAVESARTAMPDLAVTTDVIVGFPGETDDDFAETLAVCDKAGFAKIHTFPYSPRPGTPAAQWQDQRPAPAILKHRLEELGRLEASLALQFRQRFLGHSVRVLVETLDRHGEIGYCQGRADQYFQVRFPGRPQLDNEFCTVKITNADQEPLEAELVK